VLIVSEGAARTGDHDAYVVDGLMFDGTQNLCGSSPPISPSYVSSIYYQQTMVQAQWALPIQLITLADVQNALNNSNLIKAIGFGIGTTAAHELGHQFFGLNYGMEDSSINTYNGAGCSGEKAPWDYGIGNIQWEDVTANAWKNALSSGWHP
jgi:hypothetical protein